MSSPPSAVEREHVLSFHGSAGEYFRIWIVNLCFSVITLGICSAWAKVPYFIARQKGYIASRHAYGAEWRDASILARR